MSWLKGALVFHYRIAAVLPLDLLFIRLTQTGLVLWIEPNIAAYFQVEGRTTENCGSWSDHLKTATTAQITTTTKRKKKHVQKRKNMEQRNDLQ